MKIAVIGAGISGLTAAYRLRRLCGNDVDVTVLDQADRPGGKLRTVDFGAVPYDVGAEAYLARRPETSALIDELGLADEVVHPTGMAPTVRAGGRTVTLPRRTYLGVPGEPDAASEVLSERGAAVVADERDRPLVLPPGDVPLGPLLRERFGDELVDRLVDPLLGGVYAGGADGLGFRAVLPELAAAVDAGAGSLTAAAASVLPASDSDAPVFGTLRGGMSTLVNRLADASGAGLRLGTTVVGLARTSTGWRVVSEPARDLTVDGVVLAVPAPAARRLLSDVVPKAADAFAEVELASMAVVAMAFPPGTELPEASGMLIGAQEHHRDGARFTAKAFTFSSRKWRHYADGAVLVRASVGRFGEPGPLRTTDEELAKRTRVDLAALTGVTAGPVAMMVQRWGGGLPQYDVGHLERVARIERAVAASPGIEIAGAAMHGVGIGACIATADAAARRLGSHAGGTMQA